MDRKEKNRDVLVLAFYSVDEPREDDESREHLIRIFARKLEQFKRNRKRKVTLIYQTD